MSHLYDWNCSFLGSRACLACAVPIFPTTDIGAVPDERSPLKRFGEISATMRVCATMWVCIHLPSGGLGNCFCNEISYSMNDSSAIIRKISRPARCASRSARSLFHFSSLKGSVSCKSSPVVVAQLGVLQITLSVPKYDSLGKVFIAPGVNLVELEKERSHLIPVLYLHR